MLCGGCGKLVRKVCVAPRDVAVDSRSRTRTGHRLVTIGPSVEIHPSCDCPQANARVLSQVVVPSVTRRMTDAARTLSSQVVVGRVLHACTQMRHRSCSCSRGSGENLPRWRGKGRRRARRRWRDDGAGVNRSFDFYPAQGPSSEYLGFILIEFKAKLSTGTRSAWLADCLCSACKRGTAKQSLRRPAPHQRLEL